MDSIELQINQEFTVLGVLYNIEGLCYYVFTFSKNMKKYCSGLVKSSMYLANMKVSTGYGVTQKALLGRLFIDGDVPIECCVSP